MSRIVVEHTVERMAPDPQAHREIMYWDFSIKINITQYEGYHTSQEVEIQMNARQYGDFDEEFRQRLLMSAHAWPKMHPFLGEHTPVTQIDIPDPRGFLKWLGILAEPDVFNWGPATSRALPTSTE